MKDDAQSGKRVPYVWPDAKNIEKWGILQYVTKLEEKENMKVKADALLKLYNRKFKSLSIKNISGNILVRAGTSVIVDMDLGDIKIKNYMLVEKAKHVFEKDYYYMDLTLRGADIQ